MKVKSIFCGLVCLCMLSGCSGKPEQMPTSELETTTTASEQTETTTTESLSTITATQAEQTTEAPTTEKTEAPTKAPTKAPQTKDQPPTTTLKNIPKFIWCDVSKTTENVNRLSSMEFPSIQPLSAAKNSSIMKLAATTNTVREYVEMSDTVELNLCIANPERDTIVDVLLDDSQDGRNCLFSSSSTVYKIASIDTLWDEATSTFNTYVKIHLSKCKATDLRSIQIKEINFLRQIIDQQITGVVDMNADANQKSFSIFCMKPLPTFDIIDGYHIDSENDKLNYTLKVNNASDAIIKATAIVYFGAPFDKTQRYSTMDIKISDKNTYDISLQMPPINTTGNGNPYPTFKLSIEYTYTRIEETGSVTKTQEIDIYGHGLY